MKSGGAAWIIIAGFANSPFGICLVAKSPRGICHLSFVETGTENTAWSKLQGDWPRARWQRDDSAAARVIRQIFAAAGPKSRPPLRAFVKGTPFQVRVWRALLQIPAGRLTTYGRLAEAVENPAAARATGTAVGQNPVAYLIPCHRVIRETGVVGNYRWGRTRKRAIVAWETSAKKMDRQIPTLA